VPNSPPKSLKAKYFLVEIFILLVIFPCILCNTISAGFTSKNGFAHDQENLPISVSLLHSQEDFIVMQENEPILSDPSVSPSSGTTDVFFTFHITFTDLDGHAPMNIVAIVDGVSHSMQKRSSDTDFANGVHYWYSTRLSEGTHSYAFFATDYSGMSTVRDPVSGAYTGPVVVAPSFAPTLSAGLVSPPSGYQTDIFAFTVICSDTDNNTPSYVRVVIDGSNHDMEPINNDLNFIGGVEYSYNTALTPGTHSYHFEAADAVGSVRLPVEGEFAGPEVSSLYLTTYVTNSTLNASYGDINTLFEFSIVYLSQENTTPEFVRIHLSGSSYAMTQVDPTTTDYTVGVKFRLQTHLPIGNYSYTFEASNGTFTVIYPPVGAFSGPIVFASLIAPALTSPAVSPEEGEICQDFFFIIKYTSENNFAPSYVHLVLGELTYSMTQLNESDYIYSDGAEFSIDIQICDEGTHNFYFEAFDGYFVAQKFTGTNNEPLRFSVSSSSHQTSETNGIIVPSEGQNIIGFTGKIVFLGLAIALASRWWSRKQKSH
jgi:hypothetical protein